MEEQKGGRLLDERDREFALAAIADMRRAWEAGFELCRSYGDNHAHFEGEQKERHWRDFLAAGSVDLV